MKIHLFFNKLCLTSMLVSCIPFLVGCNQSHDIELQNENTSSHMQKLVNCIYSASYEDLSYEPDTRAVQACDQLVNIKVVLPVDESELNIDVPEVAYASNLHDLQVIVRDYGADLVVVEDPLSSDKIVQMSEPKIKETLSPMVAESKNYLYSIGLTDFDIQEMLMEAGADESSLIPFTLALIEHDNQYYANLESSRKWSLIPSAYAAVTWTDAGKCALGALGLDILHCFSGSTAKTWSKAVIKRAFKAAASKFLGLGSLVVFLVDFGLCIGAVEVIF